MLTIALTSIPPRFGILPAVLEGLLRQTIETRVVLSVPATYRRFGPCPPLPELPHRVEINRLPIDYGPASKLLGVLNHSQADDILFCDDDCQCDRGWAEAILNARQDYRMAVAGSTFPVSRLKRVGAAPFDKIGQGFSGVLVRRDMFRTDVFDMPKAAYAADDVWISGYLAANGVQIKDAPAARALCGPLELDGPSLQSGQIEGYTRADANTACADALTIRFGVWPPKPTSVA